MEVIRNKNGEIISRSKNMSGIQRFVSNRLIKTLSIGGNGKLMILFDNGDNFETNYGDFWTLCDFVRRWRNVYGAPLLINGEPSGKVSKDNPPKLADENIKQGAIKSFTSMDDLIADLDKPTDLHFRRNNSDYSVCGINVHDFASAYQSAMKFALDKSEVTCEHCKRKIESWAES